MEAGEAEDNLYGVGWPLGRVVLRPISQPWAVVTGSMLSAQSKL